MVTDTQKLEKYFKMLTVWGHVSNLDKIKKIGHEKWPSPTTRERISACLRDTNSALICLMLDLTGEELVLSDLLKVFKDPTCDDKRKEYERNRRRILRIVTVLEKYNLVEMRRDSNGKHIIKGTPFLHQCLIEIIPFIEECWEINDA